jgi:hypothetical protein
MRTGRQRRRSRVASGEPAGRSVKARINVLGHDDQDTERVFEIAMPELGSSGVDDREVLGGEQGSAEPRVR